MRTNEQGNKIACSKCRGGHRTSTCVDAPDHQDDVQVIRCAGRPEGSRTDPARAAERREKKRKRQMEKELEEEAAAFRREAHAFDPLQGNFAAQYPPFPILRYQNLGSLASHHAPVPSFPRWSSCPPGPLSAGIPEPIQRLLERPYHPGVGYGPAPPTPAVSLPVSAPSAPDFPLTAPNHAASVVPFGIDGSGYMGFGVPMSVPGPHSFAPSPDSGVIGNSFDTGSQHPMPTLGHTSLRPFHPASSASVSQPVLASQFDTMAQNSLVNSWATGLPRAGRMSQADRGDTMMFQTISEDLMEAGDTVLPVTSAPFPALFPLDQDTRVRVSWNEFIPGQTTQSIPVANTGVQSSGSSSSSGSWPFLDHPSSGVSPTTGLAELGTQEALASSGQYSFLDDALHLADSFADEALDGPG
ncbi:hypothetical protein FGADI_10757 [Fusarium gaditjirri]|uniref:Copper-fist domain-containing protein n=1 Tax=Fusarium gaditjirri TaxID=282569 RepID=A0A8H4SWT0_9HYPO|nr:hypothetical protein FGADI_10757 [Fusarium gaditjirri]